MINKEALELIRKARDKRFADIEARIKQESFNYIDNAIPDPVKGDKGEQGIQGIKGDKGERGEKGKDGKDGKDGSSDTAKQIRDKLSKLQGKNRLNISAIHGWQARILEAQRLAMAYASEQAGSYTETDPIWLSEKASYYTKTEADSKFLTEYTETDPIWTSEKASYYTSTQVNTLLGNYYTQTASDSRFLKLDGSNANSNIDIGSYDFTTTGDITGGNLNISNWDTAYGWGDHASAGYLLSSTAETTYLKLDASNDPITGDLQITGKLSPDGGMTSPYTRNVVVDSGGNGDFTTIKDACDYVATQNPTIVTPWKIIVNSAIYTETAFTVPPYTLLTGSMSGSNPNLPNSKPYVAFSNTSGASITLNNSSMSGMTINSSGSLTADKQVVTCSGLTQINNCDVRGGSSSATYNVDVILVTGGVCVMDNSVIYASSADNTNTSIIHTLGSGVASLRFSWIFGTGLVGFNQGSTGDSTLFHTRLGAATGTQMATDLLHTGGTLNVNNTPYKTSSGTITHIDRVVANDADATYQSVSTSQTTRIFKALPSQTANITEWQDSSGNNLFYVDKLGKPVSDVITTDNSNSIGGVLSASASSTGGTTTLLYGANISAKSNGTGNVTNMYGVSFAATTSSSGSITNVRGVSGFLGHGSSGTINDARGIQAAVQNYGSGTITNAYGLYTAVIRASGTIVNAYGIYLPDINTASTLNYAIYTNTGTIHVGDKIEFTQTDGNEYIDSLADGYMDYGATTRHRFNAPVSIADKTLLATPVAGTFEFDNDRMYLTNVGTQRPIDRSNSVITETTTVENTTTETTIYTSTVPANSLKAGNRIKICCCGELSNDSASDDITLRLKIGSTTLETFNPPIGNVTDANWCVQSAIIVRTVGATGTLSFHSETCIDDDDECVNTESVVVDTTTAENITLTIEWDNAKAGNIFKIFQGITEYKN